MRRAAWAIVALTVGLFAFAVVGAVGRTPVFLPTATPVPAAGMGMLSATFLGFTVVGGLVAARMPRNAVGWLFLATGASVGVALAAMVYVETALPGRQWAAWLLGWCSVGPFVSLPFVLLLFPDGRLARGRDRSVAWFAGVTAAVLVGGVMLSTGSDAQPLASPVGFATVEDTVLLDLGWYLLPVTIVAATACFVLRYRASSGTTRQQLKWFALAASAVMTGFVFQEATWFIRDAGGPDLVDLGLATLVFLLVSVPVACGIAMLRHRLYDIDVIINRALVYAGLSAVLATVYTGTVVAFGALTQGVWGRDSNSIAVAVSTLTAAALVRPARDRIQRFIDRRFYRRKYDAATTLAAFGQQVQRDVDLDVLARHLTDAATEAVQPSSAALWLRASESLDLR